MLYDDGISILEEQNIQQDISFKENKVTFSSIDLDNYSIYTQEKNTNLFNTNTQIIIKNTGTEKENIYTAQGTIKDIKTCSNKIAINLGSSVEFINTSGWLIKKYVSEKEIKDIVLSNGIVGIVYKDKVEVASI